jgi:hypothetical protein
MDYQEKYLKYKKKYLLLKKMQGGSQERRFKQGPSNGQGRSNGQEPSNGQERSNGQGQGFNQERPFNQERRFKQGPSNGQGRGFSFNQEPSNGQERRFNQERRFKQGRGNTVLKTFPGKGKLIQVPENGERLRTQPNDGSMEGMLNQCFWISILQHLRKNGHPNLTLRELRNLAGLDFSTERIEFDSNYESNRLAADRICALFDLEITIVPVTRSGTVLYNGYIVAVLGSGNNRLKIAQYGLDHFTLVLEDGIDQLSLNPPVPFKPLVNVNGNLTELDSLTKGTQGLFEELHSATQYLYILEEDQLSKNERYSQLLEQKDEIKRSDAYNSDEKGKYLTMLDEEIDELVKSFLNSKIYDIENQIITLQSLINEL